MQGLSALEINYTKIHKVTHKKLSEELLSKWEKHVSYQTP